MGLVLMSKRELNRIDVLARLDRIEFGDPPHGFGGDR
jgi:hypothetical protein